MSTTRTAVVVRFAPVDGRGTVASVTSAVLDHAYDSPMLVNLTLLDDDRVVEVDVSDRKGGEK